MFILEIHVYTLCTYTHSNTVIFLSTEEWGKLIGVYLRNMNIISETRNTEVTNANMKSLTNLLIDKTCTVSNYLDKHERQDIYNKI